MNVEFRPIDLSKDAETCVRFREDSFKASFGDPNRFYAESGKDGVRYLEWLKVKIESDPRTCVHLWKDGAIVGQIEMGPFKQDAAWLNINFFIVENYMRAAGFKKARLTVSPTNTRAIAYYRKHGWKMIGPYTKDPSVNVMQLCEERLR